MSVPEQGRAHSARDVQHLNTSAGGKRCENSFLVGQMDSGQIAPLVLAAVNSRARKTRLVSSALRNNTWARDVVGYLSVPTIRQFLLLWDAVQTVYLQSTIDDKFIWRWSRNQLTPHPLPTVPSSMDSAEYQELKS